MRWWYELRYLVRKLNRRRSEQEAEEEIQTHLELEARWQIEAGLSPEEARDAARRAFGSVAIAKEDCRAVWGLKTLEILWQDLRYGLRMMLKRPGFTLIVIGMLAIGIAANTTIFSIADALILRPFNFPNQERLGMIWSQSLQAGFDHKRTCCKNSLTIQDVVASPSSPLLWNVAKIFFATDPTRHLAYLHKNQDFSWNHPIRLFDSQQSTARESA